MARTALSPRGGGLLFILIWRGQGAKGRGRGLPLHPCLHHTTGNRWLLS